MLDDAEQAAEDPRHQPTGGQLVLETLAIVLTVAHPPIDPDEVDEDEQVEDADEDQKGAGDRGADRAADAAQLSTIADHTLHDPLDCESQSDRDHEHDSGMAEGEEESHPDRLLTSLEQPACRVVDG